MADASISNDAFAAEPPESSRFQRYFAYAGPSIGRPGSISYVTPVLGPSRIAGYLTRNAYGDPMCDVTEEDYAEYLLWREAASAHERSAPVRARSFVDAEIVVPKPVEQTA